MRRLLLGLVVLAASCRNPTEPVYAGPCSLKEPTGYLCWRDCPPGTAEWAASSGGLVYSASWQC